MVQLGHGLVPPPRHPRPPPAAPPVQTCSGLYILSPPVGAQGQAPGLTGSHLGNKA